MRHSFKVAALILPFVLLGSNAFSAGFALYEFSARANAMGGAVIASGAEPASLALNPALITDLKGTQAQIGATFITAGANTSYNYAWEDTADAVWTIPTAYITQQINDKLYFGIGLFPRFGLSNEYNNKKWAGATNVSFVEVTSMSLQPTVAYQVTERLSAAAGVEVMYFDFQQKKVLNTGLGFETKVEGDSVGVGGILALAYKANEKVNFGASFRTRVKQSLKGHATYNMAIPGFAKSDVNGDISLPAQFALGASWQATDRFMVEFNWTNIFWSSFRSLDINYENNMPGAPGTSGTARSKKEWTDTYRIGLGFEYLLTDIVTLRGSYIFDQSPINPDYMDVLVPTNDRHLFGAGAGFKVTDYLTVDIAYTYLMGSDLDGTNISQTPQPVIEYKDGYAHMGALSLSYKF